MTRTFRSWLPSVTPRVLLGAAALAALGVLVSSPAANADPGVPAAPAAAPAPVAPAPAPAANVMLPHLTALQPNYFYCGPSATRVALSAHGVLPSLDQIAGELGTTTNGTQSANEVTRVLNAHLGAGRYKTVEIPGQKASPAEIAALQNDVLTAAGRGDVVVANVIGHVTDTAGEVHAYEGGHYVAIVAYSDGGRTVHVSDSADTVGIPEYDLPVSTMAHWIASRGYSA